MKIYKTKIEIAKDKNVSITAVNNRERSGKVQKLFIDGKIIDGEVSSKKAGYIIVVDTLKELVGKL